MSFVLGLTGAMASGKSTVARMFAERGAPVWSSDAAVHALYESTAVEPVAALFPDARVGDRIDRTRLAEILGNDRQKLAALEKVVHPLVRQMAGDFLKAAERQNVPLCVLEIPLLFETENRYPLDAIAVTWCDPAILRQRAMSRPGMTVEKYDALLARQIPQDEKKARADFLVDTGTTLAETGKTVDAIIAACLDRSGDKG